MKVNLLSALVVIIAIGALSPPTSADESFEPISGVSVLNATATPADVGETTRLQFRLENFSSSDMTLIGVKSEKAGSGAIIVSDGEGGRSETPQLLIKEEETLDFETSHIWLELRNLKEPATTGGVMPFELVFRSGALPGRAHVHSPSH